MQVQSSLQRIILSFSSSSVLLIRYVAHGLLVSFGSLLWRCQKISPLPVCFHDSLHFENDTRTLELRGTGRFHRVYSCSALTLGLLPQSHIQEWQFFVLKTWSLKHCSTCSSLSCYKEFQGLHQAVV